MALTANAPWFVLAALMYVVGFVGYFAGKENVNKSGKFAGRRISSRIAPVWSFPIGAAAFMVSYLVLATSYLENTFRLLDNVIIPMLYSIAIGSIAALFALLLFCRINDK